MRVGLHACVHPSCHRVVTVPLPARLADAVVDGDVELCIELQSKAVGSGKRMASLAPSVTALCTPIYRAVQLSTWHTGQTKCGPKWPQLENGRRGRGWVGEQMMLRMVLFFAAPTGRLVLRVQLY